MMTVLVSPSNYQNRRKFYGANFTVRPLLFQWDRLAANQIRTIMGLKEDDNQLYINTVISILRDFQREDKMPEYENFKIQVVSKCTVMGQAGPLTQRLDILDEFIAESNKNKHLRDVSGNLFSSCLPGHLVVCDLTDPLLPTSAINGIFQVRVRKFVVEEVLPSNSSGFFVTIHDLSRNSTRCILNLSLISIFILNPTFHSIQCHYR